MASEAREAQTKDPVNQHGYDVQRQVGATRLGVLKNWEWHDDPRRFLFSMARYKFVSKMFAGRANVLELGCGDGFNAPIVLQTVKKLTLADFDPVFIQDARDRMKAPWIYEAKVLDLLQDPIEGCYDAIYSLDVLEHIPDDRQAMRELFRLLKPGGIALLSVPINPTRYETHENPAITGADARWAHFSAHDHVRYYGMDFADRLKDVGFSVETFRMGPDEEVRYALLRDEWITIATRPAA